MIMAAQLCCMKRKGTAVRLSILGQKSLAFSEKIKPKLQESTSYSRWPLCPAIDVTKRAQHSAVREAQEAMYVLLYTRYIFCFC